MRKPPDDRRRRASLWGRVGAAGRWNQPGAVARAPAGEQRPRQELVPPDHGGAPEPRPIPGGVIATPLFRGRTSPGRKLARSPVARSAFSQGPVFGTQLAR